MPNEFVAFFSNSLCNLFWNKCRRKPIYNAVGNDRASVLLKYWNERLISSFIKHLNLSFEPKISSTRSLTRHLITTVTLHQRKIFCALFPSVKKCNKTGSGFFFFGMTFSVTVWNVDGLMRKLCDLRPVGSVSNCCVALYNFI